MHYCLVLLDASSMLYAGHFSSTYKSRKDSVGSTIAANGIPVGGIRYVLNTALDIISRGDDVVVVFDSPTDKNKLCADYKGTRVKHTEIYIQQQMLLDAVKAIGIPYLKQDNYEADDLIASAMKKYRGKYMAYKIYSGDSDLASNIRNDRTTLIGTADIYPTITSRNFETTVKRGCVIPYNTILPYYTIFGKKSNNVKAVADTKTCVDLFDSFMKYSETSYTSVEDYTDISHFAGWLANMLETDPASENMVTNLFSRTEYVFPRITETLPDFVFPAASDLNKRDLAFFLDLFNLEYLRPMLGVLSEPSYEGSRRAEDYLQHYKADYFSGILSADSNTVDRELYISGDDTAFFADGDDF